MKSLLKNLGLILMIIGAAILVGVFFTGSAAINDNGVLGGSAALIVIGLIVYIVLNKRIDKNKYNLLIKYTHEKLT